MFFSEDLPVSQMFGWAHPVSLLSVEKSGQAADLVECTSHAERLGPTNLFTAC